METAANVLQHVVNPQQKRVEPPRKREGQGEATRSTESTPQLDPLEIDSVFDALNKLYGSKFTSQWGPFDEGGEWLAELEHLTAAHLDLGIYRLRQQVREAARSGDEVWPPQPVAFAALCEPRPEDLGLPTVAAAWAEACAHAHEPGWWHWAHAHEPGWWHWAHEAVRMAGAAVGWWTLTHTTAKSEWPRLEKRFAKEYGALVNRVMAGERLVPRQLLETDRAKTKAALAEQAGREAAQQQAADAGLPHRMSGAQGLAALRAATGRA